MLTLDDLEDAARIVAAHLPVTPAYRWPLLEQVTGTPTWVKHENATPTGAFKVRGGLVFVERLLRDGAQIPGLIAATRGNHGQSVAYAGQQRGLPVTIVVPEGNSPDKNASMAAFGADLVVHGRDFQESLEHARALAEAQGLVFVPSFHPDLVAGVATGAAELHTQAGRLDVVYVPVGLGSGIWWVVCHSTRMARSASSSGTRTKRETPATMAVTASSTGVRVATPSTKVSASGVLTGHPAAKDNACAGARSATTPTISVSSPSRSRTAT